MKYITNATAIIIILSDGKSVKVNKTDSKYPKVLGVFSLPLEEQEQALDDILNPKPKVIPDVKVLEAEESFEVKDGGVFYQGERLPQPLVDKVLSIIADKLPVKHFENFWVRLRENPSSTAVNELIDFLSYRELPITEDGCFLAYKGVDSSYWSIHGNKNTRVLQGVVNEGGYILNTVGSVIEVLRRDVDDKRENECSYGLHVGSKDYATNWGARTVIVKVDPKDVVSVPKDCEFQKCRVCKYEVVDSFEKEITTSVVDAQGKDTLIPSTAVNTKSVLEKISTYLENKRNAGCDEVTIRQIQNIFSPEWQTREVILNALQELEVDFEEVEGVWIAYL